jgi:hypothetical protein
MHPGVIKRSKTVSSFKNASRRHRENMMENQPVAGPHPDPDTSYETLHGCKSTRNKKQSGRA